MVEFGCVGAEKKSDGRFVVVVCGYGLWLWLWFLRKIRPTQLWVELSWVVSISGIEYLAGISRCCQVRQILSLVVAESSHSRSVWLEK